MSYKRLTEKENYDGYVEENCGNCHYYDKDKCSNKDCYEVIKRRLCELEDKIENGTLIELPCKVGDKVYRICGTPKRKFIKEKICQSICFSNFGIEIHTDGAVDVITKRNRNIFLTQAEAEKKLKELNNKL